CPFVPIRVSLMRHLLTALTLQASKLKSDHPCVSLPVSPSDWAHNLKWAIRRLRKTGPTSASVGAIALALSRKCRLCPACHTPILHGCRLQGKRIAKDRQFCDNACKMTHRRRRDTPPFTAAAESSRQPAA